MPEGAPEEGTLRPGHVRFTPSPPISQPPSPEATPEVKDENDTEMEIESTRESPVTTQPSDDEDTLVLHYDDGVDEDDPLPLISYSATYNDNGHLVLKRDNQVSSTEDELVCNSQPNCPLTSHQTRGIFADGHHEDSHVHDLDILDHILLVVLTTPKGDDFECLHCHGMSARY